MTDIDKKIFFPTTLPNEREVKDCRSYQPNYISIMWGKVNPAVLRTLIYRAIGGDKLFADALIDRRIVSELLIFAELHPPVWGTTRSLEDCTWLHLYGMCLGCNKEIEYSSGHVFPFQWVCTDCVSNVTRHTDDRPFWYTIDEWPTQYQHECVDYLLEYRNKL